MKESGVKGYGTRLGIFVLRDIQVHMDLSGGLVYEPPEPGLVGHNALTCHRMLRKEKDSHFIMSNVNIKGRHP